MSAVRDLCPAAVKAGDAASLWRDRAQSCPDGTRGCRARPGRLAHHGKLRVPENLSLLPLPSKSPEPNPTENVWRFPRHTKLSNRVLGGYEAIVEAACEARNSLIARSRPHHLDRNPPVGNHRPPLTALGIRCALHLRTIFFYDYEIGMGSKKFIYCLHNTRIGGPVIVDEQPSASPKARRIVV
jgi:hypothetical protein